MREIQTSLNALLEEGSHIVFNGSNRLTVDNDVLTDMLTPEAFIDRLGIIGLDIPSDDVPPAPQVLLGPGHLKVVDIDHQ